MGGEDRVQEALRRVEEELPEQSAQEVGPGMLAGSQGTGLEGLRPVQEGLGLLQESPGAAQVRPEMAAGARVFCTVCSHQCVGTPTADTVAGGPQGVGSSTAD